MTLPPLPTGIYRHYKGHLYQALGYGQDANIDHRVVVLYIGLDLAGAKPGSRMHARTAVSDDPAVDAWWDNIHADGSKCPHGKPTEKTCLDGRPIVARFEYLGTDYLPS